MKRLSNENGITLIELLATLAILSMISILLYGVLLNGFDYTKKSKDKVSLQQEMNIIITNLTKMHESYASYDIVLDQIPDANKIQLIGKDVTGTIVKTIELSNSDYQYKLINTQGNTEVPFTQTTKVKTAGTMQAGEVKDLFIKIIIKSKKQPSETYEVKTIISRL